MGLVCSAGIAGASLSVLLHVERFAGPDVDGAAIVGITAMDNAALRASWLAPGDPSGRCVLFLHGSGGSRARAVPFTPMLREAGYGVLAPDSRAHGESGGDYVMFGILEKRDALAWAEWMRSHGCRSVYGLGESLGASVLILAAEMGPAFDAIVADSAFADLLSAAEDRIVRRLPLPGLISRPLAKTAVKGDALVARAAYGVDFARVKPVESIRSVSAPILLIHGADDSRTPPADARALAAAAPDTAELWLVPGAEHIRSFRTSPKQYRSRVLEWFQMH